MPSDVRAIRKKGAEIVRVGTTRILNYETIRFHDACVYIIHSRQSANTLVQIITPRTGLRVLFLNDNKSATKKIKKGFIGDVYRNGRYGGWPVANPAMSIVARPDDRRRR